MNRKELLGNLDKELLINFFANFLSEPQEIEDLKKLNTKSLISKISKLDISDEEFKTTFKIIGVDIDELITELGIEEDTESNSNTSIPTEGLDPKQKSAIASELALRQLMKTQRDRALEPVIISVSPNSENDISMGKTAEVISVENQYFSKALLVPFNKPVEVPRCIYENIRDARISKVHNLSESEQALQKKTFQIYLANKYNVAVIRDEANGIGVSN
ncbi:hypothetical protein JAO99_001124 [Campylobacter coli]|uniref:hypothetical protein n=1 Tax=Campylobacter coli TaxID=195 RepID=UPI0007080D20|nr:hypothetical protein [Campylobacter coli]ECR5293035.1 hypothetical protein [Campylobacter coli]EGT0708262.1 hypothetical protein [Campylobacter coli]KQH22696.1 hypothetical protein UD08_00030 [Campylobacter coli]